MLKKVGVGSLDELFSEIPESIRFKGDYDLPSAMSEMEIRHFFEQLGKKSEQPLPSYPTSSNARNFSPATPRIRQKSHRVRSTTSSNIRA